MAVCGVGGVGRKDADGGACCCRRALFAVVWLKQVV